jgi:hypothetical protein
MRYYEEKEPTHKDDDQEHPLQDPVGSRVQSLFHLAPQVLQRRLVPWFFIWEATKPDRKLGINVVRYLNVTSLISC